MLNPIVRSLISPSNACLNFEPNIINKRVVFHIMLYQTPVYELWILHTSGVFQTLESRKIASNWPKVMPHSCLNVGNDGWKCSDFPIWPGVFWNLNNIYIIMLKNCRKPFHIPLNYFFDSETGLKPRPTITNMKIPTKSADLRICLYSKL